MSEIFELEGKLHRWATYKVEQGYACQALEQVEANGEPAPHDDLSQAAGLALRLVVEQVPGGRSWS